MYATFEKVDKSLGLAISTTFGMVFKEKETPETTRVGDDRHMGVEHIPRHVW